MSDLVTRIKQLVERINKHESHIVVLASQCAQLIGEVQVLEDRIYKLEKRAHDHDKFPTQD